MSLTRSDLLRRAAVTGGAALAAGGPGGLLVATAAANPRDEDLAWFTGLAGRTVTDPFPSVHGIDTAAEALARYLP